jgi:hypothetical protein
MTWLTLAALGLALGTPANGFAERDVKVLQTWHGQPNGYFGWAVSELADIDRDGVTDIITSEPYANATAGITWVLSGRTGRRLYRFDGAPADYQGASLADAGDTDRDGVHDIISGASGTAGPGRAYLYSGRTGRLLHRWEGEQPLDMFGSAVTSAGDVDHDGFADVAVGAQGASAVYVYSGRTDRLLRRIEGSGGFGAGLDHVGLDGLIVGSYSGGGVHVFAGARERFSLAPPPGASRFGTFFVAEVGRVDGDRVPDLYAADYNAAEGNGWAGVYSGRDGSPIWAWPGGPGDGRGPGREAGDVDHDGRVDLAVGAYTAGRVDIFSGRTGRVLRTFTSTTPADQLGFDALGIGDVDRDGEPDLLLSAAEGDTLYLVSGRRLR